MKTTKIILSAALVAFLSVAAVSAANSSTVGQAKAEQKLTEAKLKICQNKEAAIQKRDSQLTKTAENMLTKFDSIASRVETYYTSKVVPSGKTVSNYDALAAEIATKKSAAQTALSKAGTDAQAFGCTSDDPKGQLTQFRTDMQTVKEDLKAYRSAIKNLIVAIRSVTGTTESSSSSQSNQ
jgi:hypothetical protein